MSGYDGRPRKAAGAEKVLTPANVVTFCRILLVPVFLVAFLSPWPDWFGIPDLTAEWKSLIAAAIFIVISCTDWVDGYLARSRGEVTDIGKFMDPIADKILVVAALLALMEQQVLPAWPVLIILVREFIVAGVRMVAASKGEVIAASWYGKAKTVLQILAIILFLVKDLFSPSQGEDPLHNPLYVASWVVMIAALVLTVVSMIDYLVKARGLLGFGSAAVRATVHNSKACANVSDSASSTDAYLDRSYNLASAVIERAARMGVTIGTAESLTAGMITSALTAVPGSSAVVRGGVVSYAIEVKRDVLAVDAAVLSQVGAVDERVAVQMAEGARRELSADVSVAVTGIAGPGGAEPGKPVGTVWMAVATPSGTEAELVRFEGGREEVRRQTVLAALDRLLAVLMRDLSGDSAAAS